MRDAELLGEHRPAAPVGFGAAVLDRDDGILAAPLDVERDHAFRVARRLARFLELVAAGPGPEALQNSLDATSSATKTSRAGVISGLAHGFEHHFERLAIRSEARREPAFVADAGRKAALLEDSAQRVEDLDADPQARR